LYGDAAGALVDEAGALAETSEASALRAIEVALDAHAQAVVLRATALVGPTRTFTRERLRAANGGEVLVKGDLERPFSFLHEADLAELCEPFLLGNVDAGKARGVFNAAAPQQLTVRAYYEHQAALAGVPARLRGDGSDVPRRGIDASRLRRLLPDFSWRGLEPA
jgi:hypothetical protein